MREASSLLMRQALFVEGKNPVQDYSAISAIEPWRESRPRISMHQWFKDHAFLGFIVICATLLMLASTYREHAPVMINSLASHALADLNEGSLDTDQISKKIDKTSDNFQNNLNKKHDLSDRSGTPKDEMTLHLVGRNPYGARCLDGSEISYFFRPGFGTGLNKWVIFLEGGGWCISLKECYEWAILGTNVGSSQYQPNSTTSLHGIHSVDDAVNPLFFNWNHVYVNYCDGGSYSGYRSLPSSLFGSDVYFHGKMVVPSVLYDLTAKKDLVSATELLFGGESSGALGAMLNANEVLLYMKNIGSKAMVRILSDAGWFVQMPDHAGMDFNTDWFTGVVLTHNATGHLNSACVEKHKDDSWRCFLPNYNYPYISAPLFILQSSLDIYQLEYFYFHDEDEGIACVKNPMRNCTPSLFAATENFRHKLLKNLELPLKTPNTGMFVDACWAHVQTKSNNHFGSPKVQSNSIMDVINAWYTSPNADDERIKIVDNSPWPHTNQSCDDNLDWASWLDTSGNDNRIIA